MSTVIRLARFGKRHHSVYRAVVIDNRKARNDSFIEQVGFYDPNHKQPVIAFDQEKVLKWLKTGAQPSDTVASLLKKVGIMDLFHELKAGRALKRGRHKDALLQQELRYRKGQKPCSHNRRPYKVPVGNRRRSLRSK